MKKETKLFLDKCAEVNERLNEAAKNQKEQLGDLKKRIEELKAEKKRIVAELKATSKEYNFNEYRKTFQQVQNEYMFLCDDLMDYIESLDKDDEDIETIETYLRGIGFSYRRFVNPKQYQHPDRKKEYVNKKSLLYDASAEKKHYKKKDKDNSDKDKKSDKSTKKVPGKKKPYKAKEFNGFVKKNSK